METLHCIDVEDAGRIELCVGDLGALDSEDEVDLLVVSAFRGDYTPMPGGVIGALDRRGVSVRDLAQHKLADMRETSSCWLSQRLDITQAGFLQLLCFEPAPNVSAADAVGDVFRALIPYVNATSGLRRVVMPLLATGDMGRPVEEMVAAILDAATHWMVSGLPLESLKLVVRPSSNEEARALEAFAQWTDDAPPVPAVPDERPYDIFISYAHADGDAARQLIRASIAELQPSARVFVDSAELSTGMAWPLKLFSALNQCKRIVAVLTPAYLTSIACQNELNVALVRMLHGDAAVLHPFYTVEADLPFHLMAFQYVDCRETDAAKIHDACKTLVSGL
jgi:hypothetical protein